MSVAGHLVALLADAGRTVAVAESLTGGGVLDALVAVPGASACLRGGVVAYATDLKASLLGVPADLLAAGGPVQAEVARAMARGVRDRLGADYGLATTGVAGPDPQDGRPPGEWYVAVAGPRGVVVLPHPAGPTAERSTIRAEARQAVLDLALRQVGDDVAGRL